MGLPRAILLMGKKSTTKKKASDLRWLYNSMSNKMKNSHKYFFHFIKFLVKDWISGPMTSQ